MLRWADTQPDQVRAGHCKNARVVWRPLDIVVNAATIHRFGTVLETDLHTWNECMMMNVGSMYMYLMAHLGIPEMKKRGGGSILDIASVRRCACQFGEAA